jgi:hypothetical protein
MTEASKADLVHARLKEEIELGELAPGTALSELSLVERTGASRTPVSSPSRCSSATDSAARTTPPAARFAASARSSTSPG